jgi:outer membrane murein-binding lipoprotein Lpp
MPRYILAAALAIATIALAGCQSKQATQQARQQSKQQQLKGLQQALEVKQNAYLADCPLANMDTGTPKRLYAKR